MAGGGHPERQGPPSLTHIRAETNLKTKLPADSADDVLSPAQPDGLPHTSTRPDRCHQTCRCPGIAEVPFSCSQENPLQHPHQVNCSVSQSRGYWGDALLGGKDLQSVSPRPRLTGISAGTGGSAQSGCCRVQEGARRAGPSSVKRPGLPKA